MRLLNFSKFMWVMGYSFVSIVIPIVIFEPVIKFIWLLTFFLFTFRCGTLALVSLGAQIMRLSGGGMALFCVYDG